MNNDRGEDIFTSRHHAMLFGWIAREVVQQAGQDKGERAIRQGVRRYGEQRGRRMALRALADGHALDMRSFMLYGEWRDRGGDSHKQEMTDTTPHAKVQIHSCSWNTTWEEESLIPYGRLYCLEVDEALVRGFNSELKIEVNGALSGGAPCCEFVFHQADLTPDNLQWMEKQRSDLGDKAVMPWAYHLGHLYKTLGEVVHAELGRLGERSMKMALDEFGKRFGDEAAEIVVSYSDVNFDRLPEER